MTATHTTIDLTGPHPQLEPDREIVTGSGRPLPLPPTLAERHLYLSRQVLVLTVASVLSLLCLSTSQVHFLALRPWLWVFVPFLAFTLAYYLISLRVNVGSRNFDIRTHDALVAAWKPATAPSVDVFLPICGEDLTVLANTWRHVSALARAYRGTVTVYVLDDGDDPGARGLAGAHGFRYVVRPNRGEFKKAGNLRHGYSISSGDFILILDADFAPSPDLFDETLPYFDADARLGIVQTPQFFRVDRRQSWMERGAGGVQELFYRLVQVSRDRLDAAICVGSCGVYRRSALDEIGGTTLIEHSEDVHTGFDLRRAGWNLRYLPLPLATGLCPPDPDSFLTQQYRWCAGSMSLLTSKKFWTTKMRVASRLCYLSGFSYYVHTALATFVVPLIPITLLLFMPHQVQLRNFAWIVPSILYNLVVFPLWNRVGYGPTSLMARSLYGWAHAFAIHDDLRGRRMGWQTTGSTKKKPTARMWKAIAVWGGATSAAWLALALWRAYTLKAGDFAFLLLAGFVYAGVWVMVMASRRQAAHCAAPAPTTRPARHALPPRAARAAAVAPRELARLHVRENSL